jgi:hypothetical protein
MQTNDGGYAIAGYTSSFGAGNNDFWLVKTDGSGNMQWNKTYGGTDYDDPHALVQTGDGGFALAGSTNSFAAGIFDFWLVRTDASGNMLWNKTYPGTNDGVAYALVKIGDGGFALAGEIDSTTENSNFYLVKVGSADQGLSWVSSSTDTITIYRATGDLYWNYVRVRILKIK